MIKVGILGTGFGMTHLKLLSKMDGVEVVSMFGRNYDKLKKITEEYGVKTTTSLVEVIEDDTIDLIDICLPTSLHAKYAIEAIEQGKHVLCETPFTYSIAEGEAVVESAKKQGVKVFVDLFMKFSAPHHYAMNLVKSMEIGNLISVTAYNRTPSIWGSLGLGNIVTDFMCHNIDFVGELLGIPTEVQVIGIGDDDKATVNVSFKYEKAIASLESSSFLPEGSPFSIGFNVTCEKGNIAFDGSYGVESFKKFEVVRDGKIMNVPLEGTDDCEEMLKHVIECLEDDTDSLLISGAEALKTIRTVDRIQRQLIK